MEGKPASNKGGAFANIWRRDQQIALFGTPLGQISGDLQKILSLRRPRVAMQLAGLWPAIHEWESKHYSQLQELLALLRLHNATNPELRKGDTAAVWAARYYFYRREQNWEIAGINSRGLKVSILGDELQLNYHIYHYSTERRGYVYFKFAKDWDENSALCTLGAIRLFDERNIQANPDLFSTNLPVQFEYVNLLLDEAHCLTDEQYAVYLREMTSHINQAQERSVA